MKLAIPLVVTPQRLRDLVREVTEPAATFMDLHSFFRLSFSETGEVYQISQTGGEIMIVRRRSLMERLPWVKVPPPPSVIQKLVARLEEIVEEVEIDEMTQSVLIDQVTYQYQRGDYASALVQADEAYALTKRLSQQYPKKFNAKLADLDWMIGDLCLSHLNDLERGKRHILRSADHFITALERGSIPARSVTGALDALERSLPLLPEGAVEKRDRYNYVVTVLKQIEPLVAMQPKDAPVSINGLSDGL